MLKNMFNVNSYLIKIKYYYSAKNCLSLFYWNLKPWLHVSYKNVPSKLLAKAFNISLGLQLHV